MHLNNYELCDAAPKCQAIPQKHSHSAEGLVIGFRSETKTTENMSAAD